MNTAVRYILKSIVQTHGMGFTRSQRLCNAYLADLMPDFPEERRQLVVAVADGLPYKLLLTHTHQQRKELALQFGQAHSIPTSQALQAVDTWFYALQNFAYPKQFSPWLSMPSYLGGLLTGIVILLVGSALAFYKKQDEPVLIQQVPVQTSEKLTLSSPLPAPISLAAKTPITTIPPNYPLQTIQAAENPFLLLLSNKWPQLDALNTTGESLQSVLLQTQPASAFERLATSGLPKSEPESKRPAAQSIPNPPLNTISTTTPLATATTPLASKPHTQPEKRVKQPIRPVPAPTPSKTKTTQLPDPVETKPLFTKTTQEMQALVEQVLRLRKKQADQNAVIPLLNLTDDPFYRQQLTGLEKQIDQLYASLDHLSESYSIQVAKLCGLSPTGWQNGKLITGEREAHKIQQWVLQDWKQCKGLSSQKIKQQLLTRYQITPK